MSIIRTYHNKKNPYVMINKVSLWDSNLPLDVIGLWARLLSRPDDWQISIIELAQSCGCDKKRLYRILNILIKQGYAYRHQTKDEHNKFNKVEYYVFEEWTSDEQIKEMFPQSAFALSGVEESGPLCITKTSSKEDSKNIPKGPKAPSISADAESLYIFFLEEIKKRFPNFKQPNKEKWLLELDRLLRIDKRSLEEVKECILWIENDNWFKANILSPSSLRKSYDKIYANMLAFKDKNRIRENREWAIKQKELHKEPMKSLSFDKDFARNVSAGKEIPFNLPIKSFREALIAMFGGTYRE